MIKIKYYQKLVYDFGLCVLCNLVFGKVLCMLLW